MIGRSPPAPMRAKRRSRLWTGSSRRRARFERPLLGWRFFFIVVVGFCRCVGSTVGWSNKVGVSGRLQFVAKRRPDGLLATPIAVTVKHQRKTAAQGGGGHANNHEAKGDNA